MVSLREARMAQNSVRNIVNALLDTLVSYQGKLDDASIPLSQFGSMMEGAARSAVTERAVNDPESLDIHYRAKDIEETREMGEHYMDVYRAVQELVNALQALQVNVIPQVTSFFPFF